MCKCSYTDLSRPAAGVRPAWNAGEGETSRREQRHRVQLMIARVQGLGGERVEVASRSAGAAWCWFHRRGMDLRRLILDLQEPPHGLPHQRGLGAPGPVGAFPSVDEKPHIQGTGASAFAWSGLCRRNGLRSLL
jgi:hypothetical protein